MNLNRLQIKESQSVSESEIFMRKDIEKQLESREETIFNIIRNNPKYKLQDVKFSPSKIIICNSCLNKLFTKKIRKQFNMPNVIPEGHYRWRNRTIILSTSFTLNVYLHELYHHFQNLRGEEFIFDYSLSNEEQPYEIEACEFTEYFRCCLKQEFKRNKMKRKITEKEK